MGDGEGLGDGDELGHGVGVGPEGESTVPHETAMTTSQARPATRTANGMGRLLRQGVHQSKLARFQNADGERDRAGVPSVWLRIDFCVARPPHLISPPAGRQLLAVSPMVFEWLLKNPEFVQFVCDLISLHRVAFLS